MSEKKKGLKFDSEKPPLDLLSSIAIYELGRVLDSGAKKYSRANWANGIEYSRLISAALRHILQFNEGEDIDSETQTSHIANAMCNLMFLLHFIKTRPDLDNRWIKLVDKGK